MSSIQILSGVYAAAVTPLNPDLTPDLAMIPELLAFLAERGAHGALLLGTTGEGPSFSQHEREAIFKAASKVKNKHPEFSLLAGTGTPSLEETIHLNQIVFIELFHDSSTGFLIGHSSQNRWEQLNYMDFHTPFNQAVSRFQSDKSGTNNQCTFARSRPL